MLPDVYFAAGFPAPSRQFVVTFWKHSFASLRRRMPISLQFLMNIHIEPPNQTQAENMF